jgi:hypothetical protein
MSGSSRRTEATTSPSAASRSSPPSWLARGGVNSSRALVGDGGPGGLKGCAWRGGPEGDDCAWGGCEPPGGGSGVPGEGRGPIKEVNRLKPLYSTTSVQMELSGVLPT